MSVVARVVSFLEAFVDFNSDHDDVRPLHVTTVCWILH